MNTPTQNINIDYKLMDINYLKRYEQYNIRMTPQEEYNHNENIIKSFMKRQEELKIVIRREEKIEMNFKNNIILLLVISNLLLQKNIFHYLMILMKLLEIKLKKMVKIK